MLIGALNPDYIDVVAIADIRPYSRHRAFHGDWYSPERQGGPAGFEPGVRLQDRRSEARKHVKVYENDYDELLDDPNVEAVIIALPLFMHHPMAVAAMQKGKHVLYRKADGARRGAVQGDGPRVRCLEGRERQSDRDGGRPSAALQHSVRQRGRANSPGADRRHPPHSRPVASRQLARER